MSHRHTEVAADEVVEVMVNGATVTFTKGSTVIDVVRALVGDEPDATKGIAVALEREVVPRSAWSQTIVHSGTRIEVVTAAAGG